MVITRIDILRQQRYLMGRVSELMPMIIAFYLQMKFYTKSTRLCQHIRISKQCAICQIMVKIQTKMSAMTRQSLHGK